MARSRAGAVRRERARVPAARPLLPERPFRRARPPAGPGAPRRPRARAGVPDGSPPGERRPASRSGTRHRRMAAARMAGVRHGLRNIPTQTAKWPDPPAFSMQSAPSTADCSSPGTTPSIATLGSRCSPQMMSIIIEPTACWNSVSGPFKPPGPITLNASFEGSHNPTGEVRRVRNDLAHRSAAAGFRRTTRHHRDRWQTPPYGGSCCLDRSRLCARATVRRSCVVGRRCSTQAPLLGPSPRRPALPQPRSPCPRDGRNVGSFARCCGRAVARRPAPERRS